MIVDTSSCGTPFYSLVFHVIDGSGAKGVDVNVLVRYY